MSAVLGWGLAIASACLVVAGGAVVVVYRALRGLPAVPEIYIPDTADEFLELTR